MQVDLAYTFAGKKSAYMLQIIPFITKNILVINQQHNKHRQTTEKNYVKSKEVDMVYSGDNPLHFPQ